MNSIAQILNGFSIFGIDIAFYGVIIAFGMLLGIIIAGKNTKYRKLEKDDIYTLALYVLPLAIIGARLYFVIFYPYTEPFLQVIFDIKGGGLAIYGGVIGGAIGAFLFCLIHKKNFIRVTDVAVISLILGQAIGRWGNFINQEAYGNIVTNPSLQWFPFAVFIDAENAWHMATFFYESFFNLIIFATLMILIRKIKIDGVITSLYFVLYGFVRLVVEGFRTDSLYIGETSIRVSQLLSGILIIGGIIALIILIIKDKWKRLNLENQPPSKKQNITK
jgi:phosphatidylglycerol:prolipoprotein diacylglycerol transferase